MDNTSLSIVASSEAVYVDEAPLSEMPPGAVDSQQAWEQWCRTLHTEHEAAERVPPPEFEVIDDSDRRLLSLRTRQVMAFQALVGGKSIAGAAREAGVGRATLHRWMKDDPNFKAALARQRDQQVAAAREQLNASVEAAARTIHDAIRQGHVTASMNVLKSVGLLGARQADQEPRPARAVGNRAALALEARLGQLLSMLARHPAIAGTPEDAPENAEPEPEAQSQASSQQSSATEAAGANPMNSACEQKGCLTNSGDDNSAEAKE